MSYIIKEAPEAIVLEALFKVFDLCCVQFGSIRVKLNHKSNRLLHSCNTIIQQQSLTIG